VKGKQTHTDKIKKKASGEEKERRKQAAGEDMGLL
jgi:hypothetical protein